MSTAEVVYNGRDNTIDLLLKAADAPRDLSSVTRMLIVADKGAFSVDSADRPAAFDWDTGTTGKLILALGHESLPVGVHACRLVVYDPANADGVVWGNAGLVLQVV